MWTIKISLNDKQLNALVGRMKELEPKVVEAIDRGIFTPFDINNFSEFDALTKIIKGNGNYEDNIKNEYR